MSQIIASSKFYTFIWCQKLYVSKYASAKVISSCPDVFCKKVILKNFAKFTVKHLVNKVTGPSLVYCEFCKISEKTFYYWTPKVAASEKWYDLLQ